MIDTNNLKRYTKYAAVLFIIFALSKYVIPILILISLTKLRF